MAAAYICHLSDTVVAARTISHLACNPASVVSKGWTNSNQEDKTGSPEKSCTDLENQVHPCLRILSYYPQLQCTWCSTSSTPSPTRQPCNDPKQDSVTSVTLHKSS